MFKDAGELLRAARESRGLSQAELAKRIGSTQTQVWRWEHGHRSASVANIVRILDALGYELGLDYAEPSSTGDDRKTATQRGSSSKEAVRGFNAAFGKGRGGAQR